MPRLPPKIKKIYLYVIQENLLSILGTLGNQNAVRIKFFWLLLPLRNLMRTFETLFKLTERVQGFSATVLNVSKLPLRFLIRFVISYISQNAFQQRNALKSCFRFKWTWHLIKMSMNAPLDELLWTLFFKNWIVDCSLLAVTMIWLGVTNFYRDQPTFPTALAGGFPLKTRLLWTLLQSLTPWLHTSVQSFVSAASYII